MWLQPDNIFQDVVKYLKAGYLRPKPQMVFKGLELYFQQSYFLWISVICCGFVNVRFNWVSITCLFYHSKWTYVTMPPVIPLLHRFCCHLTSVVIFPDHHCRHFSQFMGVLPSFAFFLLSSLCYKDEEAFRLG